MVAQVRLGEMLIAQGIITDEQLQQAIFQQKNSGEKIGQALVSLGFITEKQFLDFFAKQLNIPFYDLKLYTVDAEIALQLSESYARLYHAIILKKQDSGLLVGMTDPLDVSAIDKLRHLLNKPLSFALIKEQELERVFTLVYRHTKEITGFARALSEEINKEASAIAKATGNETQTDAPVINLLNTLFNDASQMNASDIHIEPNETMIRIRLRIDGMLHEQIVKEPGIMPAIVSRLKLMSGLNISEKRMPQDGRFGIEPQGQKFDVRLSTMPTPFGESVVMRLLPQTQGMVKLDSTGMSGEILKKMRELFLKPNGIILVTGPTGSGKSTTLYAAINEINRPEIKIITIEDPIEYFLPWAVQIQVNEKINLDFATVLRGILRHDPDVILLGEMRDKETSSIAMRTALTGRLVLSTLHTNDALSSVYRLIDLGIEPYMIASTTQAILAQRLIRLICPNCIEDATLNEREKTWLAKANLYDLNNQFKVGKGCSFCGNTGFHGRAAIFELLEFNEMMSESLRKNDQDAFHKEAAKALAGKLLIHDAYQLAVKGRTTISELLRVINEGYALQ
ncbi:MAG: GspE/PulE family protein [Gammaproteobacteria bacterium]|nr:GspE/PulE family protein [Gammaproteobacteria bacterium]